MREVKWNARKLQEDMKVVKAQSAADLKVSEGELKELDEMVTKLDKEDTEAKEEVAKLELMLADAKQVAQIAGDKLTDVKVLTWGDNTFK